MGQKLVFFPLPLCPWSLRAKRAKFTYGTGRVRRLQPTLWAS